MTIFKIGQPSDLLPPRKMLINHHCRLQAVMDASCTDRLILLIQNYPVLYNKSAAGCKVKDALIKGDIWQIGVKIGVNSEYY